MNKQLVSLMQKEMTRKEFLATLGFGAASVMGLGAVLRLAGVSKPTLNHKVSSGYGGSAYGR
jgi:hypothetical protein